MSSNSNCAHRSTPSQHSWGPSWNLWMDRELTQKVYFLHGLNNWAGWKIAVNFEFCRAASWKSNTRLHQSLQTCMASIKPLKEQPYNVLRLQLKSALCAYSACASYYAATAWWTLNARKTQVPHCAHAQLSLAKLYEFGRANIHLLCESHQLFRLLNWNKMVWS